MNLLIPIIALTADKAALTDGWMNLLICIIGVGRNQLHPDVSLEAR
jgi:hypothetical protein